MQFIDSKAQFQALKLEIDANIQSTLDVDYCARTFSLPMHPYLTEAEQDEVIQAVLEAT